MKKETKLDIFIGLFAFIIIGITLYLLIITETLKAPQSIQNLISPVSQTDNTDTPPTVIQMFSARVDTVSDSKIFVTALETNKKHTINIPSGFEYIILRSYPDLPNVTKVTETQTVSKKVTLKKDQVIVVGVGEDVTKLGTEINPQTITITISEATVKGLVANITPNKMQVQLVQQVNASKMAKTLEYATFDLTENTQYTLNYNSELDTYDKITIDEIKASHESEFVTIYSSSTSEVTGNQVADLIVVTRAKKL